MIGFGFFVIPHLAGLSHEIPITSRWSFLFNETLLIFKGSIGKIISVVYMSLDRNAFSFTRLN